MKGLLLKDLFLLKGQMRSILIIICAGAFLAFSLESTAAIGYLTVLGSMLAVSTLTYDEHDGGFRFLFTLPFRRRTYVYEKYLLAFGMSVVFTLIGIAATILISILKQSAFPTDLLESMIGTLFAGAIMYSVMIPLRIKYGSEGSRYVTFVLFAGIAVIALLLTRISGTANILHAMAVWMDQAPWLLIAGMLVGLLILLVIVSIYLSVKAIEQKEF